MCKNHDRLTFKDAVVAQCELEVFNLPVCDGRQRYIDHQVEKFEQWLATKGDIAPKITIQEMKDRIKTHDLGEWEEEFIWTPQRADDESLIDIAGQYSATRLDVLDAFDYGPRMDDEENEFHKYWGSLYNHAVVGERKFYHEEREHLMESAAEILDQAEQSFNPVTNRLDGKYKVQWTQRLYKMRARLNSMRFRLRAVDYETWAYITNWINVLLGVDKQYPCAKQNIGGQQYLSSMDEDQIQYEIINTWYTRD